MTIKDEKAANDQPIITTDQPEKSRSTQDVKKESEKKGILAIEGDPDIAKLALKDGKQDKEIASEFPANNKNTEEAIKILKTTENKVVEAGIVQQVKEAENSKSKSITEPEVKTQPKVAEKIENIDTKLDDINKEKKEEKKAETNEAKVQGFPEKYQATNARMEQEDEYVKAKEENHKNHQKHTESPEKQSQTEQKNPWAEATSKLKRAEGHQYSTGTAKEFEGTKFVVSAEQIKPDGRQASDPLDFKKADQEKTSIGKSSSGIDGTASNSKDFTVSKETMQQLKSAGLIKGEEARETLETRQGHPPRESTTIKPDPTPSKGAEQTQSQGKRV